MMSEFRGKNSFFMREWFRDKINSYHESVFEVTSFSLLKVFRDRISSSCEVRFAAKSIPMMQQNYYSKSIRRRYKVVMDVKDVVEWCTIGEFEKKFDLPHGTIRDTNGRVFRRNKRIGILPKEGEEIVSFVVYTSRRKKLNKKEEKKLLATADRIRRIWSGSSDKED